MVHKNIIIRKICFIDFDMSVTGGVEQVTARLANELSKYYEVHLISVSQKGRKAAFDLNDSIQYRVFFKSDARLRDYIVGNLSRLRKYLKANKIDVAILMGNYPGIVSIFVKPFVKTKFVFCDHGALMNQWEQKDVRYIRLITSKLADKTITLTKQSMNAYIKKFHLKKDKVDYIYNWTELPDKEIEYNSQSKKILSVGRFGKEKGYDMLLEVAQRIFVADSDWEWHIYGDGETFQEVTALSKEKGLERKLVFHGNCPNVSEKYKDYAMLVLTSYREGLPLVLLEGKSSKLPMVSFDISTGPDEIIEPGVNGYLIEPYNTGVMAEKIIDLMENDALRKQFSDMAYQGIEKFEKELILQKWIALIEKL